MREEKKMETNITLQEEMRRNLRKFEGFCELITAVADSDCSIDEAVRFLPSIAYEIKNDLKKTEQRIETLGLA